VIESSILNHQDLTVIIFDPSNQLYQKIRIELNVKDHLE